MPGSAYHRIARLATHPAFRRDGLLHCPLCLEAFDRVPPYTAHFLSHAPSLTDAYNALDARAYERYRVKVGADPVDAVQAVAAKVDPFIRPGGRLDS